MRRTLHLRVLGSRQFPTGAQLTGGSIHIVIHRQEEKTSSKKLIEGVILTAYQRFLGYFMPRDKLNSVHYFFLSLYTVLSNTDVFDPIMGPSQLLPFRVIVGLGVMAMKDYSKFPRSLGEEPNHLYAV